MLPAVRIPRPFGDARSARDDGIVTDAYVRIHRSWYRRLRSDVTSRGKETRGGDRESIVARAIGRRPGIGGMIDVQSVNPADDEQLRATHGP